VTKGKGGKEVEGMGGERIRKKRGVGREKGNR